MTNPNTRLLVVDDDVKLCEMLCEYLEPEGFDVATVHDGAQATHELASRHYDLIILDVMLPGISGLDVLRAIRTDSMTPVLMLTARGDDVDRIVGLEIGADDYLSKPFNPRELVARIRAILRRSIAPPAAPAAGGHMAIGALELEPGRLEASWRGEPLKLTGAEFRVLETLARSAGAVVSRAALTETALGRKLSPYDRSIDTHVSNLRRKLAQPGGGASLIRNVRGVGYLLAVEE